jgi:hypothetical protein
MMGWIVPATRTAADHAGSLRADTDTRIATGESCAVGERLERKVLGLRDARYAQILVEHLPS